MIYYWHDVAPTICILFRVKITNLENNFKIPSEEIPCFTSIYVITECLSKDLLLSNFWQNHITQVALEHERKRRWRKVNTDRTCIGMTVDWVGENLLFKTRFEFHFNNFFPNCVFSGTIEMPRISRIHCYIFHPKKLSIDVLG